MKTKQNENEVQISKKFLRTRHFKNILFPSPRSLSSLKRHIVLLKIALSQVWRPCQTNPWWGPWWAQWVYKTIPITQFKVVSKYKVILEKYLKNELFTFDEKFFKNSKAAITRLFIGITRHWLVKRFFFTSWKTHSFFNLYLITSSTTNLWLFVPPTTDSNSNSTHVNALKRGCFPSPGITLLLKHWIAMTRQKLPSVAHICEFRPVFKINRCEKAAQSNREATAPTSDRTIVPRVMTEILLIDFDIKSKIKDAWNEISILKRLRLEKGYFRDISLYMHYRPSEMCFWKSFYLLHRILGSSFSLSMISIMFWKFVRQYKFFFVLFKGRFSVFSKKKKVWTNFE